MEKKSNRSNRQPAKSVSRDVTEREKRAGRLKAWRARFERRLIILIEDTWHTVPAKENLARYVESIVFILEGERVKLAKIGGGLRCIEEGAE